MCKKRAVAIFMVIALTVSAGLSVTSHAEEAEQDSESMGPLMQTVSIDVPSIQAEAERLGIPEARQKKYISDIRALNQDYQQGSLTRTEYIAAKREIIERLK